MPIPFPATDELLQSGHKYRRELLIAPFVKLAPILAHMTQRRGVQGKETVGTLINKAQLRPYKTEKGATDTTDIAFRELETYLGDVVEEFDVNVMWNTLYGNVIGEDATNAEIARAIAISMAGSVGESLATSIFTAKRNIAGNSTMDLFDGFETIIAAEETAGTLTSAKLNLTALDAIDINNAVDVLRMYYRSSHEILRGMQTKMFLPWDIYDLYCDCYQANYGHTPYNAQYKKTTLEGSDGRCELVPMSSMSGERLILTPRSNMLVGSNLHGDSEKVEIRRADNPKVTQFFMLLYLGVQFESIDARLLNVGKITE